MNGSVSIEQYRQDASSNSITTTYDEAVAATGSEITHVHYGNSSADGVYLAIGAAAAEEIVALMPPGSHGMIPCVIPKGVRVAIKGDATISSGIVTLDLRK